MGDDFGVMTRKPLDHWGEILRRWCDIIDQHCRIIAPQDRPWWHGERACAGLIASAAHQCGLACSLEISLNRVNRTGQCDLWLQRPGTGTADPPKSDFIELKLDTIKMLDDYPDSSEFERAMEDASSIDVTKETGLRIGACLYEVSTETREAQKPYIFALLERIANKLKPDAMAWSFPQCIWHVANDNTYHFGAILVLKNTSDAF